MKFASNKRPASRAFGGDITNKEQRPSPPLFFQLFDSKKQTCIHNAISKAVDKYQYIPSNFCSKLRKKYSLTSKQIHELHEHYRKINSKSSPCDMSVESNSSDSESGMLVCKKSDGQSLFEVENTKMKSGSTRFANKGMDWDYTKRVYSNLMLAEIRFSIKKSNILYKSPKLNFDMRTLLIDWLHEVSQEYDLKWQTLLLGVQIIDHYLHNASVTETQLQLVGCTALLIASKMEEIQPLSASQLVYISDNSYSRKQVIQLEQYILNALGWNVTFPTPYDFMSHLFMFFDNNKSIQNHSIFFIDIFIQEQAYLNYNPSELAAGALLMAVLYNCKYKWTDEIIKFTGYSQEYLFEICTQLNAVYGHCQYRTRCKAAFLKHTRDAKRTIPTHVRTKKLMERYTRFQ